MSRQRSAHRLRFTQHVVVAGRQVYGLDGEELEVVVNHREQLEAEVEFCVRAMELAKGLAGAEGRTGPHLEGQGTHGDRPLDIFGDEDAALGIGVQNVGADAGAGRLAGCDRLIVAIDIGFGASSREAKADVLGTLNAEHPVGQTAEPGDHRVTPAGELRNAEQCCAGLADIVDVVARAHPFSRSIFAS
jgi:hypothetical protein